VNPDTVAQINAGRAPVQEPRLQEFLTANRPRIRATTDWAAVIGETEITYVIVPTPSGADGTFKTITYWLRSRKSAGFLPISRAITSSS
jgi:UDPglucose 6-dehydrogenase